MAPACQIYAYLPVSVRLFYIGDLATAQPNQCGCRRTEHMGWRSGCSPNRIQCKKILIDQSKRPSEMANGRYSTNHEPRCFMYPRRIGAAYAQTNCPFNFGEIDSVLTRGDNQNGLIHRTKDNALGNLRYYATNGSRGVSRRACASRKASDSV